MVLNVHSPGVLLSGGASSSDGPSRHLMPDLPDGVMEVGQSLTPAVWLKGPRRRLGREFCGGDSVSRRYHRHAALYRRKGEEGGGGGGGGLEREP